MSHLSQSPSTGPTGPTAAPAVAAAAAAAASQQRGISVLPLGAGQDVGRSCIVVSLGGKTIMLDCGMHMGYFDSRRFPDFSLLLGPQDRRNFLRHREHIQQQQQNQHQQQVGPPPPPFDFASVIDCVIVSHFHLDHCGALPYFTERVGYSGPIYMTYPTKSVAPILLEDMRKIMSSDRETSKGTHDDGSRDPLGMFTDVDIVRCLDKVEPIDLNQRNIVDDAIELRAYYAGHVLGAAMFHVKVGDQSLVYTGDYNMTPDRHLGAAWIDRCRPDLLITETTYATTVRGSKRSREHDFLRKVHDCVSKGGKVLIPVFALGRAQELCILLEGYWSRMQDLQGKVPVYFSGGMTERANEYYKLFINWTNEKIRETFADRNMFDFKHIKPFKPQFADNGGPMVVFASPGMLHAGTSLNIFKKWCHDSRNMVILPGYCVAGTVGAKILAGDRIIEVDQYTRIVMNMQVENLSFSAHADSQGIIQLIRMCEPRAVMLVHGEAAKMKVLATRIRAECLIPCIHPANGESVLLPTAPLTNATISESLLSSIIYQHEAMTMFDLPKESSTQRQISSNTGVQQRGMQTWDQQVVSTLRQGEDSTTVDQNNVEKIAEYVRTLNAVLNVSSDGIPINEQNTDIKLSESSITGERSRRSSVVSSVEGGEGRPSQLSIESWKESQHQLKSEEHQVLKPEETYQSTNVVNLQSNTNKRIKNGESMFEIPTNKLTVIGNNNSNKRRIASNDVDDPHGKQKGQQQLQQKGPSIPSWVTNARKICKLE